MSAEDFSRRRVVWLILTVVAFLSPNFWLYVLVAIPTYVWAGRKDSNPVALYLFVLHVIPPVAVPIPILGNNGLFLLDNYRLLAFCVLLPAAMHYRKNRKGAVVGVFGTMDIYLIAWGVLTVALYVPPDLPNHFVIPDSPSNALRRAFLFALDSYLLYYAVSRTSQSGQKIVDAAASFCLACAVMAAVAMFEHLRSWLLYVDIVGRFGSNSSGGFYLSRAGSLRAQASAGHALSLGYLLAVAFGFWLYLKSDVESRIHRIGVSILLWGGLFAAFSRGPWLGAVIVYFTFKAAGPRAASRLVKGAVFAVAIACLIAISPLGDRILEVLPVMGKTADFNVLYRHRLAERCWQLVLEHPFFGNQFPWPEMEDLRQGEGIIDMVNSYLGEALVHGFIGLFLFVGFIIFGMTKVYVRAKDFAYTDPGVALLGASLIACIAGTLVMIQSTSFGTGVEKMFYVLAGLSTAYAQLKKSPRQQPVIVSATNAPRE
jgi:O-Antigen ligase